MSEAKIDIVHVAKLARLALDDAEIDRFGAQLGSLLEHVRTLESLPLGDIAATAQVIAQTNVTRDDVEAPSLPRAAWLEESPAHEGAYVRVPRIIGEAS